MFLGNEAWRAKKDVFLIHLIFSRGSVCLCDSVCLCTYVCMCMYAFGCCSGLNDKCPLQAQVFEYGIFNWCCLLGRLLNIQEVEPCCWKHITSEGFECLSSIFISSSLSTFCIIKYDQRVFCFSHLLIYLPIMTDSNPMVLQVKINVNP